MSDRETLLAAHAEDFDIWNVFLSFVACGAKTAYVRVDKITRKAA